MFSRMLAGPTLRSMLFKFIYGFVTATVVFSNGWLGVHTDPQAWTLASFGIGIGTALVAFVKDFIFRVLIPGLFSSSQ